MLVKEEKTKRIIEKPQVKAAKPKKKAKETKNRVELATIFANMTTAAKA
ncbi:MAG: hypothetical protein ACXAEU_05335 [Candidatus Hodarchaeales archaeon]